MSVHRLELEQQLRAVEAEREAEELRMAERVKRELAQPVPDAPVKVVRVFAPDARLVALTVAADLVERWWATRRRGLLPSDREVARLIRRVRRGGGT